ncbi:MAG: hypothetical protein ACOYEA_05450 [Fermentimonas sp.]|jgi:phage shock protein A
MEEDKTKILLDLEVRIKQLLYLCDSLKEENERLRSEIEVSEERFIACVNELEEVKAKYDSLKIARTITAASVDVESATVKLSKLVRDVDKCINLLK